MRFTLAAGLAFVLAVAAHAQPAPPTVQPGYMAYSGCQPGYPAPCFIPFSPENPMPVTSAPATVALTPLDASTVATGGTAVTALLAGHRARGGWIQNPSTATAPLCINEIGTAATTSAASTTCVQPGQMYTLAPSSGGVSVNSTDDGHVFSGYGFN
jgi:hypothetical protein